MGKIIFAALFLLGTVSSLFAEDEAYLRDKKRLVLITGCSRSGTWYITEVLNFCGLKVDHERYADDGCVSWLMAVDALETPYGPGSLGLKFDHIFHQVRDPLATISSVYYTEHPPAWDFTHKYLPEISSSEPLLDQSVKFWIYWNRQAEKKAEWTYRIEDIEEVLPIMGEKLGVYLNPLALKFISKETNHRFLYKKFTWRDLEKALPRKLFEELQEASVHYGYSIID